MIHFVVAMPCEARPIVEFYAMEEILGSPFRVYASRARRLIVCGIGKVNAAVATTFLHIGSRRRAGALWINVGVAGHRNLPLGEIVAARVVHDRGEGRTWPLEVPAGNVLPLGKIMTVERPERNFEFPWLCDMEASGFYAAARRFSPARQIQCLKIVSDNASEGSENLNAERISGMVRARLPEIAGFAENALAKCSSKVRSISKEGGKSHV